MSSGASQRVLRIGTRGSALALAQARIVADALGAHGRAHEIVTIETDGDRRAPDTGWGEGAFVKAIEQALLDGRADIAVHSAKDVPTDEQPALAICAYMSREDPRDALVVADAVDGATIDSLPPGSIIGTDSPRRTGFLRALRPDLDLRPLHGNVDTRLRRLDAGEVDALVLAVAGLVRLGREQRISQRLPVSAVPPAPGQGAICVQVRADDVELLELGALLDHLPTHRAVEAERAFLHAAGGGCRAPIGALAEVTHDRLHIVGGFATVDGRLAAIDDLEGGVDEGLMLAGRLAASLIERRSALVNGPRVLITRPADEGRRLATSLAGQGINGIPVPTIAIEPTSPGGEVDAALARLDEYAWAVVTSANGASAFVAAAARERVDLRTVRWAAVGESTAHQLRLAGVGEVWLPGVASAEQIGMGLPIEPGEPVLLVRGSLAGEQLPAMLRARGAEVDEVVAYLTLEAPEPSRSVLAAAMANGGPDAVIFASPSAVRGLLRLAGAELHASVLALPAICIGPTTTAAAREAGFTILGRPTVQDATALAEATAELLHRSGLPA